MAVEVNKEYLLGEFSLDPDKRELRKGSRGLHLASRPFRVLLHLIEHRDRLVTRSELLEHFWQGKDIYDETLTKCVGAIRKALDDRLDSPRFIETRYAEGYRYIGPLEDRFFKAGVSVVEIERTRGVKVVIEEEEIQEAAQANEQAQPVQVPATTLSLSAPKTSRRAMLTPALALIVISLAVGALITYRTRARSASDSGASRPALAPINSIAVLPLRNLSGDPAQEYFSDGLTEGFITELSKVKGLKVISRSSVFTFKGKEIDPREVGQKLGVVAILEGSVLKSGDNVRVEVRLVSTEDGRVLWANDNYDRAPGDIFKAQDEIARGIVSSLRLRLNGAEEQQMTKRYTNSREAYDDYLKGRYYWNERTIPDALSKAVKYFEDAVQKDPDYALAYSGLSDSYVMSYWYTPMSSNEAFVKARQAAEKAVQLDDTLSEAHTSLAAVADNEWNWKVAETEFQRAIELNPNYATAHHWYALHLLGIGNSEKAIEEIRRAQESDPLSLPINADVGYILYGARRYDEAITEYKKALELKPDFPMALQGLAQAYVKSGKPKEAVALIARLPDDLQNECTAGYLLGVAGERDAAKRILAGEIQRSTREYVSPTCIALVQSGLGDTNRALFWLEKSFREHSPDLSSINDPMFDGLRTDPRFVDLVTQVRP
ncbi:MAG TPA: tetratricopeptide repeat protein [Pyrinomonadaceae bacterium]|jgi:TolB-like protein/DNA-binding winged helix-turn-helix (wHTH) protein/Flp pilus assembly protein TadD|nr:tetratricopeptide repeat protein [Pyrinomonadaceae bacterium]